MSLLSPDPMDTISVAVYEYTISGDQASLIENLDRHTSVPTGPVEESFLVFSRGSTNQITLYFVVDLSVVINEKTHVFCEWDKYSFVYSNGRTRTLRPDTSVRNPSRTTLGRKVYIIPRDEAEKIYRLWCDLR